MYTPRKAARAASEGTPMKKTRNCSFGGTEGRAEKQLSKTAKGGTLQRKEKEGVNVREKCGPQFFVYGKIKALGGRQFF